MQRIGDTLGVVERKGLKVDDELVAYVCQVREKRVVDVQPVLEGLPAAIREQGRVEKVAHGGERVAQHDEEERARDAEPGLQQPCHHHVPRRLLDQHRLRHVPVPPPLRVDLP